MPAGRTHNKINLIVLLLLLGILTASNLFFGLGNFLAVSFWLLLAVFVASYLFSNFMLSPDLDLYRSSAANNWGVFKFIWYPYSKIFKHRGLSHSILVGAPTRIIYLMIIAVSILLLIDLLTGRNIPALDIRSWNNSVAITVVVGLYFPSVFHVLADRTIR